MHGMKIETESFVDRHVDTIAAMIVSGSTLQEVRLLKHVTVYIVRKSCQEFRHGHFSVSSFG